MQLVADTTEEGAGADPSGEARAADPQRPDRQRFAYVACWADTYGGRLGGRVASFAVSGGGALWAPTEEVGEGLNPSHLFLSSGGTHLYVVDETAVGTRNGGGAIADFELEAGTGRPKLSSVHETAGAYPCHAALNPAGRCILAVNHGSRDGGLLSYWAGTEGFRVTAAAEGPSEASLAVLPLMQDGAVGHVSQLIPLRSNPQEPARSKWPEWQDQPWPHSVACDSTGLVVVCERGTDCVRLLRISRDRVSEVDHAAGPAGHGPRTSAFHPSAPFIYVTNEIMATVSVFAIDREAGRLSFIQNVDTVPREASPADSDDFFDWPHPSDLTVHPNGRFLYVANRHHESIAVFDIDLISGTLTFKAAVPCGGRNPRSLVFDPKTSSLYVVNTESGSIMRFSVSSSTGALSSGQEVVTGLTRPVSLALD